MQPERARPLRQGTTSQMRHRAGFSLIELLVCLGILAVLIGILIPTISSSRESARAGRCLSNVRSLAVATISYQSDHADFLPWAELPIDVRVPHLDPLQALFEYTGGALPKVDGDRVIVPPLLACPSDQDIAAIAGSSYWYVPSTALGVWIGSPERTWKELSLRYRSSKRRWPLWSDSEPRHRGVPAMPAERDSRTQVGYNDGSAGSKDPFDPQAY